MARRNTKAPNLKVVKKPNGVRYYYYRMPNGQFESLCNTKECRGQADFERMEREAIEAANALNTALRESGKLVERVLKISSQPQMIYDPSNPPMDQVLDEYHHNDLKVQFHEGKISRETYKAKLLLVNEYSEALAGKTCQEVSTFDMANHLRDRTGNVQVKHVPFLKRLFAYAIANGYCDANPANLLQPKAPDKRKRKRHTLDGFIRVRNHAPRWLQRTMDIALYSLQRRADLVLMGVDQVDQQKRTLEVLQQKTRNYRTPVYLSISMGDSLWKAVHSAIKSDVPCPYLVHYRPARTAAPKAKKHPFAVTPDYLTKEFKKARDKSGAYDHLPANQRPTLHDIRALGIMLYHKAGYPMEYIMALAGHSKASTTDIYLRGHEKPKPIAVGADLSLSEVDVKEIDWDQVQLPSALQSLVDEGDA